MAWRLSGWRSTVRLGLPDFLGQMDILWHHVTGVPIGTGSMTPRQTSRSRPAFTSSCQWTGTGIGTETALLKVKSDVDLALDQGDAVLVTVLDLSAAFDTVDLLIFLSHLIGVTHCHPRNGFPVVQALSG